MNTRAQVLAQRRARLLERSASLRESLRQDGAALALRLRFADRLLALAGSPWMRMLAAAGGALLLFRRPRRLLRLALRFAPLLPTLRPALDRMVRAWRARRASAKAAEDRELDPVSPPP